MLLPVTTHPLVPVLSTPVSIACIMYFFYRSFLHANIFMFFIDTLYLSCYYRVIKVMF